MGKPPSRAMPQLRSFRSSEELRAWMAQEHARASGLLLRIYKKDSGVPSVTYAEALDQALCFGWIDGQKLPFDANSWVQKFTPRRARSSWSKKNVAHADRLVQEGRMTPAGLQEIDRAKADGRWAAAYDSPANATVPPEFVRELARNAKAKQFYATLDKANLYAIAYRLQTAKRPETRAKRTKLIIEMLARGEKFH
ncbi:YdeI/OmpD-associated family protein [Fulvimonas sp. R45]|uniref:YdeI/OmpD-associated family protein n=1 Tax=Fulvimonas sp. R45 TaxID=3045937 RepID=UPI00265F40BC|nr:YdeI/OmpD-associated family protein [Fulvimonas sp. R45]MDO1529709.1 YdeI/OmpD-associated family protein [Fulvimonas sp. R45]